MGYQEFTDLPVWQAARAYKLAIYTLCREGPLCRDGDLCGQLRAAARKPPAHIAEAYARFNPADSARLLTIATAELVESQNHLIDAADQDYITEAARSAHHKQAQGVIDQIEGWRTYLQSPDALRNVREIREQARRRRRLRNSNPNPNPNSNPNSGMPNSNPNSGMPNSNKNSND